jgi:hypothetical protein
MPPFIIENLRQPDGIQYETKQTALLDQSVPIFLLSDLSVLSDGAGK